MDMRVIGYDPFAQDLPGYVEPVALDEIWRQSDMISLHCPLTADNVAMVNGKTLALCKTGLILVNTGRGGLIDEQALVAAVAGGKVAMAGLERRHKSRHPRTMHSSATRVWCSVRISAA